MSERERFTLIDHGKDCKALRTQAEALQAALEGLVDAGMTDAERKAFNLLFKSEQRQRAKEINTRVDEAMTVARKALDAYRAALREQEQDAGS